MRLGARWQTPRMACMLRRGFSSGAPAPSHRRPVLTFTAGAAVIGAAGYHYVYRDIRSSSLYSWLVSYPGMALLKALDPETAHHFGVWAAAHGLAPMYSDACRLDILRTQVLGLSFDNPIGLAAGFDKQAEAMPGLLNVGFGFVEVGTVTPEPQPGNPKPRMFRLVEDRGVINRFGFNSDGLAAVARRLSTYARIRDREEAGACSAPHGVIGVNVGKNKTGDVLADYISGVQHTAPFADYLVINVSSPNTPGLRNLQQRDTLRELLVAAKGARDALPWGVAPASLVSSAVGTPLPSAAAAAADAGGGAAVEIDAETAAHGRSRVARRSSPPPLFLKIAPDVSLTDLEDIAAVVLETRIDGVICTNTTVDRPAYLRSPHAAESGGLSGKPVMEPSTRVLSRMYTLTKGQVPLIGVGGVFTAEDAYRKIRSGASLVQVYSSVALEGPALVPEIVGGLARLVAADGFSSVGEAVGADHRVVGANARSPRAS